jgi:pimeloyl-ACP methyl ester carboxylesterase
VRDRAIAVVVGLAALVVLVIAVTWIAAGELPNSANRDFGLQPSHPPGASDVTFASGSGVLIQGWLSQGTAGKGVVMLLHGLRGDRRDMVPRAKFLLAQGYSVLLFDFQAHGQSKGARVTFGDLESRDVTAALQYLRHKLPNEKVGVLGVSLGAAAFALADGRAPVAAVVLEQMYPTVERAVEIRTRLHIGPLAPIFAPLLCVEMQSRLKIPEERLRPLDRMGKLGAPVLIVAGTRDNYTPIEDARALFAAAPQPKELWAVEGAGHEDIHAVAKADYERRVTEFFGRYLGT